MTYTTVKSDLARRDVKDTSSDRCPSRYTLPNPVRWGYEPGTVLKCSRPASGHRIHESGSIQWEKGDR